MKFAGYRKMLTRNFSQGVPLFYKVSDRNALKQKELNMAPRLHPPKTWEELAEDPFRGLRAGPADFSPFTSAAVSRKPPDHTKPPTPRTTEHGRGVFRANP